MLGVSWTDFRTNVSILQEQAASVSDSTYVLANSTYSKDIVKIDLREFQFNDWQTSGEK